MLQKPRALVIYITDLYASLTAKTLSYQRKTGGGGVDGVVKSCKHLSLYALLISNFLVSYITAKHHCSRSHFV